MAVENGGVALVTGASSGIGLATAQLLAKAGYRVFGTSRSAAPSLNGVTMLVCDVTDDASVGTTVEQVVRSTGRLDLVVNNAGVGLLGGAEDSSIAQASRLFDVNLFGVARVVNAALPVMRKQKRGRIINVSSILGLIPQPFSAYYSSTKHALEGYSESLDHEVRNFGVRVVLVEPGVMRTAFEDNITRPDQPIAAYEAERSRQERLMRNLITRGDTPEVVAKTILEAAMAEKPKLRYPAGKQARQIRSLRRLLPDAVFDKAIRRANELPAKAVSEGLRDRRTADRRA